ncbi:hypothetical protein D3C71_1406630 [compost metagenome]
MRERREQQHACADLDQRDQMRRRAGQALDDQRGYRIKERSAQCQSNTQQVLAAALALPAMGADNRQHPEKRDTQPRHFLQGDLLVEKHRGQTHQHERLNVVDRGADGNRGAGIGREQQHPVANNRHPAEYGQQERGTGQNVGAQEAEYRANQQQRASTEQAAPEHHVQHRLPGHQHKPADGSGDQHGGGHFERAATYCVVHLQTPLLMGKLCRSVLGLLQRKKQAKLGICL